MLLIFPHILLHNVYILCMVSLFGVERVNGDYNQRWGPELSAPESSLSLNHLFVFCKDSRGFSLHVIRRYYVLQSCYIINDAVDCDTPFCCWRVKYGTFSKQLQRLGALGSLNIGC